MIFKIKGKSHWRQIGPACIVFLVLPFIPWYFALEFGPDSLHFAFWVCLIFFLVFLLPIVTIHLNYFLVNKNYSVEFSKKKIKIVNTKKNAVDEIPYSDIESIRICQSFAKHRGSIQFVPWDDYSFMRIIRKSGKPVTITSLLVPSDCWPKDFLEIDYIPSILCLTL